MAEHHNKGNRYAAKGVDNAEAYIHARCTLNDKQAWKAAAKKEGVKLTAWIIKVLNNAVKNVT